MFPGQSGKIVATFMSSRTTAAAAIGRVDPEGVHRRPDREQLDQPAGRLEHCGERCGLRLAQDVQTALRHRQQPRGWQRSFRQRAQLAARDQDRGKEERDADDGDQLQARDRPLRDPRGREHERGQQKRGDEVEEAVREDGSEQAAGDPLASGRPPASTPTRASSPIRPGSTAFARRPTANAENTRVNGGCCELGRAWRMTDVPGDGADEHGCEVE